MVAPLGNHIPTRSIMPGPGLVGADAGTDNATATDQGTRGPIGNGPLDPRVERVIFPARQAGPTNQQPHQNPNDLLDPSPVRDLRPSVERFTPMILRSESYGVRDRLAGTRAPIQRINGQPTAKQLPWTPPRAIFRTVPNIGDNAPLDVGAPAITASRAGG